LATTDVKPSGPAVQKRAVQLPIIDAFLWLVRIAAVVVVAWGAFNSLTSGRLDAAEWRSLIVVGLAQGSVYALIALGYTMVYGVLRFINFAHGEVFMVGAMTGFFVTDALAETALWRDYVWVALIVALLCCMTTSTVVALLLDRVCYRPLRGLPRLIPFITAIGASFFLQYAIAGLFGTQVKAYPRVEPLRGRIDILGVFPIQKVHLLVIVAALVMMVGLYLYIEKTKAGKAIRAVAEDQEIARLMGINVDRTIARVFAIGGAVAGGLTLGSVESLGPSLVLEGYNIPAANQLKDVVAFSVLVLVLIFRPTGLLGERLSEERA
jgi:branched-chain amino acid transport system permease protein